MLNLINPVSSFNLISSILLVWCAYADVEVTRRDCEVQRYGKFARTKVATKNLIFESSERRLKIVLNCTFCDHLMYGRRLQDGKWYAKRGLEEPYEPIDKRSADVELIDENRLKITNYHRNIGFYSCQPDAPTNEIVVQILVDHVDLRTKSARMREQHFLKFEHKDQFVEESARLVNETELALERQFADFGNKFRLLYAYHKDSACSKCNLPDQNDQVGVKFMIFKCTLIELSFLKFNDSLHVEPSVSCGSSLVRNYDQRLFERLNRLPAMGFKHPCRVACDQRLPNLTQISVTEKPSILSVFEAESKGLLNSILERVGFYPVPYSITPAFNLTTINVSALEDRELKLACPVDSRVETKTSSIFWYHNRTLISPLKLRIITDNNCRIKDGRIIFSSLDRNYNGSYICTYMKRQVAEFRLFVEAYAEFDVRNPLTVYIVTVYVNLFAFFAYHLYKLITRSRRRKKIGRSKRSKGSKTELKQRLIQ